MLAAFLLFSVGCGHKAGQEQRSHGTIKAINLQTRTLVLSEKTAAGSTNDTIKIQRTYHVADDCKMEIAAKPKAELGDLRVGDRINVRFTTQDGKSVIRKITPHTGSADKTSGAPQ